MQCQYCDSHITPYPANGLCPNCGAVLPPDDTPRQYASAVPPRPVSVLQPGVTCCEHCRSTAITVKKRGFGWIAGLIGLFFLPPFGLLFGLIGRNRLKYHCTACGHKWERQ